MRRGQRQAHQTINDRRKTGTWHGVVQPVYGPEPAPHKSRVSHKDAKVLSRLEEGWIIFAGFKGYKPKMASLDNKGKCFVKRGQIERLLAMGWIERYGTLNAYRIIPLNREPIPPAVQLTQAQRDSAALRGAYEALAA